METLISPFGKNKLYLEAANFCLPIAHIPNKSSGKFSAQLSGRSQTMVSALNWLWKPCYLQPGARLSCTGAFSHEIPIIAEI